MGRFQRRAPGALMRVRCGPRRGVGRCSPREAVRGHRQRRRGRRSSARPRVGQRAGPAGAGAAAPARPPSTRAVVPPDHPARPAHRGAEGTDGRADRPAPQDQRRAEHDHLRRRPDHGGGQPVSVIGVNPATFRSWVPLQHGVGPGLLDGAVQRRLRRGVRRPARTLELKPGSSTTSCPAPPPRS